MMKKYSIWAALVGLFAVSFAFVGFQCSSAELTSAKLYMQKSEWDKAETELDKAVNNDSLDEESWYYLGIVRGEKKNYTGLMDAFDHALKISSVHKKDVAEVRRHYWLFVTMRGARTFKKVETLHPITRHLSRHSKEQYCSSLTARWLSAAWLTRT